MATNPVETEVEATYEAKCTCGFSGDMEGYKTNIWIAHGGGQRFWVSCPACNHEWEFDEQ